MRVCRSRDGHHSLWEKIKAQEDLRNELCWMPSWVYGPLDSPTGNKRIENTLKYICISSEDFFFFPSNKFFFP